MSRGGSLGRSARAFAAARRLNVVLDLESGGIKCRNVVLGVLDEVSVLRPGSVRQDGLDIKRCR